MTDMELSPAQRQAAEHKDGPMLVLAGPGSGKTAVITRRTRNLIERFGVNPARILVITFTRAAAEEMKERFLALTGEESTPVSFGTFHAVYFKILKYAYHYSASNIITEEERQQALREIVSGLDLELEDEKEFLAGIAAEISLVKGERMDVEHYYSMNCADQIFRRIYQGYEERLERLGKIDFDDMLLLCYELLTKRPDILRLWQQKYTYILIDEFQDINRIQYDIIRMLAKPENNLFIVGDDDQSIYRFRGARPEIMLNFEKEYPGAKRVVLDRNYRSCGQIVRAAGKVIKNNKKRFAKDIHAVREEDGKVEIRGFAEFSGQNQAVVNELLRYHEKGIPYREMAVLFRTNLQPRALASKLMEYNIPFCMKDAVPNLYDHWIAGNLKAYMQIAKGARDRALFLQIANRPKRYLSREAFQDPVVSFDRLRDWYSDKDWMIERIDRLEYDIAMLKTLNPYAAIQYIRQGIGYDGYLEEYARYRRMKPQELFDILGELAESAKEYQTYDGWFAHMEEYKAELAEQARLRRRRDYDGVSLATMHSVKGLEYRIVFIVDANEEITPHHKAAMEEELEEERRLFYVAMTRAKDCLYILYSKERYNKELAASRYIGELLLDPEELAVGCEVMHVRFGAGRVIGRKKETVTIRFRGNPVPKTFHVEMCVQQRLLTVTARPDDRNKTE